MLNVYNRIVIHTKTQTIKHSYAFKFIWDSALVCIGNRFTKHHSSDILEFWNLFIIINTLRYLRRYVYLRPRPTNTKRSGLYFTQRVSHRKKSIFGLQCTSVSDPTGSRPTAISLLTLCVYSSKGRRVHTYELCSDNCTYLIISVNGKTYNIFRNWFWRRVMWAITFSKCVVNSLDIIPISVGRCATHAYRSKKKITFRLFV